MDRLKELKEYLLYILAVTKSFGGPCQLLGAATGYDLVVFLVWAAGRKAGGGAAAGTVQTKDLSALSSGNGPNHTEQHGGRQHLKMEKIIRSFNTSSSQG